MLLFKPGFGVKDAFTFNCASAREQKSMMDRLTQEAGGYSVSAAYAQHVITTALADGLTEGLPPAPGLLDVARICGLDTIRPHPKTTLELLNELSSAVSISGLSPQRRGRLINASEMWLDDHPIVETWGEDCDEALALLEGARSLRSAETALWKWLEGRREWWARIFARSAGVLDAAGDQDAQSFAACAIALLDGRDLKKIPVMSDIHEQTIGGWIHEQDNDGGDISFVELPMQDDTPEEEGELAKFLRGTQLTPDWLDGFLTSIVVAPALILRIRQKVQTLSRAWGLKPVPRSGVFKREFSPFWQD